MSSKKKRVNFSQAILGARPRHAIFRSYLEKFLLHYRNIVKLDGFLGTIALKHALAEFAGDTSKESAGIQLFEENRLQSLDGRLVRVGRRSMNPQLEAIPLQPGSGCCCDFVVVDRPSGKVPFYSRVVLPGHVNMSSDFCQGLASFKEQVRLAKLQPK